MIMLCPLTIFSNFREGKLYFWRSQKISSNKKQNLNWKSDIAVQKFIFLFSFQLRSKKKKKSSFFFFFLALYFSNKKKRSSRKDNTYQKNVFSSRTRTRTYGWCHGAHSRRPRPEIQLGEEGLPQVLRSPPSSRDQLPQEALRPHLFRPPQEEA